VGRPSGWDRRRACGLPRAPHCGCRDLGRCPPFGGSVVISPDWRIEDVLLDALLRNHLCVRRSTDLATVLSLIAQWCGALVDALTMLEARKETGQTCVTMARALRKMRSNTHRIGRSVHPERLGAFPIVDVPAQDISHPRRHLPLGDLALHDPGGVRLPPVLKGRVDPVLDGLNQPTAEAYSNRATGQPLYLQPLQVV
jgi:hypothetical protein